MENKVRLWLTTCPQNKLLRPGSRLLLCLALLYFACSLLGSAPWWDSLTLDEHRLFNRSGASFSFRAFRVHRFKVNVTHAEAPRDEVTTTTPSSTPSSAPTPTTPTTPPPHFHQAYAPKYRFTVDHPDACRPPPFLVLMVPVAPRNVAARDAIRRTWGEARLVLGERVLTMFVLGRAANDSLHRENLEHGDLIQSDFTDSYRNLTIKTMVIMHWLATRCANATFAMKVDSDMFLNVANLVAMLKTPEIPRTNYLTGMLMRNRPVVRSKSSKWFVPEELYSEPRYPTYALGAGYVFSNDLPAKLVRVSRTIEPFDIEDAYVGKCMKELGLALTAPPNPGQFKAYNFKYDRCQISKVISCILGSSQQLLQYWADLQKPGPLCQS